MMLVPARSLDQTYSVLILRMSASRHRPAPPLLVVQV